MNTTYTHPGGALSRRDRWLALTAACLAVVAAGVIAYGALRPTSNTNNGGGRPGAEMVVPDLVAPSELRCVDGRVLMWDDTHYGYLGSANVWPLPEIQGVPMILGSEVMEACQG